MDVMLFDMNVVFPGKVVAEDFSAQVAALDFTPYSDKQVQLRGCAPSWAHLLVAAKLLPIVARLEFIIDDGNEGRAILIK